MKITNGKIIALIGVIHTVLTPVVYPNQFKAFAGRFFFRINNGFMEDKLDYETFAAFWCLYFGLILFTLGVLLDSIEKKKLPIPKSFIIVYSALVLVGVYMIPWGGMTVFMLPHVVYLIVSSRKKKNNTISTATKMNKVVKLQSYPENTMILTDMDRVDYFDSYMIVKNTPGSVSEITQKLLKSPGWVNALGKLRDILVKPFGLKTENDIKTEQAGNHEFDFAPVIYRSNEEIVMGMNDKHLYFRLSVLKIVHQSGSQVFLTTIVRFNNVGGRIYFALIRLFHGLIVRTMLKRL